MKINQGTVFMTAERQAARAFASLTFSERVLVSDEGTNVSEAAVLKISSESHAKAQLESQLEQMREQWEQKADKLNKNNAQAAPGETEEDFKIKMLRRLMESLRAMQEGRRPDYEKLEKTEQKSFKLQAQTSQSFSLMAASVSSGNSVALIGNTHWEEKVTMSTIFTDKEVTCFSTMGSVRTSDGRCIDFQLNLEMSREFTSSMTTQFNRKSFCVDPLVINLDGNPASFSDQTFFFDLNSDGQNEELAQLSAGSGFLALDKNNDSRINNGNELFGTQSGDGFKDLASYDKDKNGWIDENDSIFKDLKIWTKDSDGNNRLIGIGAAGIGAIYLGNTSTEFSLNKTETNETQGIIRSTGIFLRENGEVGSIQHVDYVV